MDAPGACARPIHPSLSSHHAACYKFSHRFCFSGFYQVSSSRLSQPPRCHSLICFVSSPGLPLIHDISILSAGSPSRIFRRIRRPNAIASYIFALVHRHRHSPSSSSSGAQERTQRRALASRGSARPRYPPGGRASATRRRVTHCPRPRTVPHAHGCAPSISPSASSRAGDSRYVQISLPYS